MKLGALGTEKLAEVGNLLTQIAEGNQRHAQTPSGTTFTPGRRAGPAMSQGQLGVGLLQSIVGDVGGLAGLAIPFLGPWLKRATGGKIDLAKMYRMGYGGDDAATKQALAAQNDLMNFQKESLGASAGNLAGLAGQVVDNVISALPKFIQDELPSWLSGGAIAGPLQAYAKQNPGFIGQVLAPILMQFPEVQSAVQALDPNLIVDARPFRKMTTQITGGEYDTSVAWQVFDTFRAQYDAGMFQPEGTQDIPASLAANALQHTMEMTGDPSIAFSQEGIQKVRNAVQVADRIHTLGLAPFGESLELARSLGTGYLDNPNALDQRLSRMGDAMVRAGMDPEQLMQTVQVARERGADPLVYMHTVTSAGLATRRQGTDVGQEITPDATRGRQEAVSNLDLLATLAKFNPTYREAALRTGGDPAKLWQLGERAKQDRQAILAVDPSAFRQGAGTHLLGKMTEFTPDAQERWQAYSLQKQLQGMGQEGGQLGRLLRDKGELRQAVQSGDWSQLGGSKAESARLGSLASRHMPVINRALSIQPDYLRYQRPGFGARGGFKYNPRAEAPELDQPEAPIQGLGVQAPRREQT